MHIDFSLANQEILKCRKIKILLVIMMLRHLSFQMYNIQPGEQAGQKVWKCLFILSQPLYVGGYTSDC
ncbi:hypothetical protein CK934_21200 [Chitinophaga sp. MD30]|nr:hypothetical protein CK934_21200 [Chitinophaga sp. MD30]